MDRLKQAALDGNMNELYACLQGEKDKALRWIDEAELVDTPLHIAARKGHDNFALAMMHLKPSCARKLNEDMYSPMHIAVQNRHKDVVLALLKADKDLVRVIGKEGYTALHSAAQNGETGLLVHFLLDCPACIEDVTFQNETALHVAAKNGELKALGILARFLQRTHIYCEVSRRHILDSKDREGNTVLHFAARDAHPQMVKLLLECQANTKVQNKVGFTALDLLKRKYKTDEVESCLTDIRNAGGKILPLNVKQKILDTSSFIWYNLSSIFIKKKSAKENLRFKVTLWEQTVMLLSRNMANLSADKINAMLVILALILTSTYQAMLSPPGGVWQADYSATITSAETHVGQSVMNGLSFLIFHNLNFLVFVITSFFTVCFLQILCDNDVIALITELLFASLMWCIVIAWLVTRPTENPPSPLKSQALACLAFIGLFVSMEANRRFHQFAYNPPLIAFFRNVFRQM